MSDAAQASAHSPAWSDEAINSTGDDKFERAPFAKMIARRIDQVAPRQASTVFGVVGEWGSGKTSVLNMIRESVSDDWKVVPFSPWAVSSADGLSRQFLAALRTAFDELPTSEQVKRAKSVASRYARVATPWLKFIPVVGDALSTTVDQLLEATAESIPSWDSTFATLSDAMGDLGHRVLIVADDVDRLDPDELLELLKVVRLLGRFPNVHYLLAYDQESVEALLSERGFSTRAGSFMEKIIQYPYELPAISEVAKRRLLSESLTDTFAAVSVSTSGEGASRASELIGILGPSLDTPRSHARYREQLLSVVTLVDVAEVDLLDLAAITYVRVFAHELYAALPDWHHRLRTGKWQRKLLDDDDISEEEWREWVRARVAPRHLEDVLRVLSFLFSPVSIGGLSFHEQHGQGFSDEKYVQRYLVLGLPADDVSDSLVSAGVDALTQGHASADAVRSLTSILDGSDDQRSALAGEKALLARPVGSDPSVPLTRYVWDRTSGKPDTFSFMSAGAVLGRWFVREATAVLRTGDLTVAELRGWMGDDAVIGLTQRILQNPNLDGDAKRAIGEEVVGQLNESVLERMDETLLSAGRLSRFLRLRARVRGADSIRGVLDETIDAASDQTFLLLAAEFVEVWTVVPSGEVDQIGFDLETWRQVASDEQTRSALERLADPTDSYTAATTDPTPENLQAVALGALLAAFPQPSAAAEDGGV